MSACVCEALTHLPERSATRRNYKCVLCPRCASKCAEYLSGTFSSILARGKWHITFACRAQTGDASGSGTRTARHANANALPCFTTKTTLTK